MLSRIFLWTYISINVFAVSMSLRPSKQKRWHHFRRLWLVKEKVTSKIFLLHFLKRLFRDISCNFLIMVLISILSLSLSSNKLHNSFNCYTNLLMPMSSLLISNEKVLSGNWLATNNNFWCRQRKKANFRCINWTKEIFFWQFDKCRFLNKRWTYL